MDPLVCRAFTICSSKERARNNLYNDTRQTRCAQTVATIVVQVISGTFLSQMTRVTMEKAMKYRIVGTLVFVSLSLLLLMGLSKCSTLAVTHLKAPTFPDQAVQ